ncbi:MAG: tetratricopeptide repeat protein [Desulfuromonadaceae bacterium]|nr:tetratricopeptide repeat protein [Desulfuromonadaceae bacterium]
MEVSRKVTPAVDLALFKELLLRTCGHSFEKEREQTLVTALQRRMAALGIDAGETYHATLVRNQDELLRLTELLTVNETYFFREPEHLSLMVDTLMPEFMAARNQKPVRIVSAGCSTGEEPYSIAIMLRERFGDESERLFAITGVDIDSTVIATAKQGVYGKGSFRGVESSLFERYFEPCGSGKFQVCDAIRKQVGFEVVNLLGASYPQRMQSPDIILYRNVSIYFPGEVQREIFGRLAELLADGGCLLVGAAETFHHDIGILSLVKQDSLFYYRKTPPLVFEERRAAGRPPSTPARSRVRPVQTVPLFAARSESLRNRPQAGRAYDRPLIPPYSPGQPDVRERFDAAIKLAHDKQPHGALTLLDAVIAEDSAFEKAYTLKGSLLLSLSRFDEVRSVCETILGRDPLRLEAYLMLGMVARQKGDIDDALTRFREALFLDSSCWLAHFYSAEILFAHQDGKRARSGYDAALRILEKGSLQEHGQDFFPLSFNAEQFMIICRHKLSLLTPMDAIRTATKSPFAQGTQNNISNVLQRNG